MECVMDKSEVLISVNRRISSRRAKFLQAFTILNNDSDKDVNNEKDDMFETITAKEQVMIFLMTKDSFLLQGFWQLKDNHEMIKINSLSEIKKVGNKPFKVIIDTYHNHILDEEAIKFLEKLDAERIIVLAPYHISKLKAKAPKAIIIPISTWIIVTLSDYDPVNTLLAIQCFSSITHYH